MSLLFRSERRDWTSAPPIPANSERRAFSTRRVDLSSTESSLQKVAVYAAVKLLRDVVETHPIDFFSGTGESKRQIAPPKWMLDPQGDGHGLPDWMGQVVYCDGLRGNAVGIVPERDPVSGAPRQIVLQHPDHVSVHRNSDGVAEWYISGKRTDAEDVWHKRSFAIPGSILGLSPIAAHALTIGLGISAAQFGAQFFLDGGHPTALFQNTQSKVDPAAAATIKARIKAVLAGNREPLVLGADWDYKPLQVAPNDSQFLETNGYTSAECARIFGPGMPAVLGYETGGSMTYANVEQFNQQLLTFTLDPWLVRLERMLSEMMPRPQYAKFNRGALLRTDLLTRFRAHEIAIRNDFETVNEVRELEDRKPVDWGNEPRPTKTAPPVPVQMET